MRKVRRSRLMVPVLALFLAAHFVCGCATSASATPSAVRVTAKTAAADPHACCHPERSPRREHTPAAGCQHCSHAQWTAPEANNLPAPPNTVFTVLHAPAATALAVSTPRFAPALGRGSPPSLPIPPRSCVLRL